MTFGESSPGIPILAGFHAPVATRTASKPFSRRAAGRRDRRPRDNLDSAFTDQGDLPIHNLLGQAILRNPVAQHPSRKRKRFINGHPMSLTVQIVGRGKPAGAGTDDGHLLSGRRPFGDPRRSLPPFSAAALLSIRMATASSN